MIVFQQLLEAGPRSHLRAAKGEREREKKRALLPAATITQLEPPSFARECSCAPARAADLDTISRERRAREKNAVQAGAYCGSHRLKATSITGGTTYEEDGHNLSYHSGLTLGLCDTSLGGENLIPVPLVDS